MRLDQEREISVNFEQHSLIFELSYDKETILVKLIPKVVLVYKILQDKFALKKNSHYSTITLMFATDPSNPWSWSVIFDLLQRNKFT